jgi:hypothetical protein
MLEAGSFMSDKTTKAEAGLIGARRRWGAPRIVRLDALPPSVATAIRALVAASAAANEKAAPVAEMSGTATSEGTRDAARTP